MKTKVIEATNGFNWGKFMLGRFDPAEWRLRSGLYEAARQATDTVMGDGTYDDINAGHPDPGVRTPLLQQLGWGPDHLWVLDLQTGEGGCYLPGGSAKADLEKHRIWVCPMYEPFLHWLYQQDLSDIDALPICVELPDAPSAVYGYRRPGPEQT